MKKIFFLSYGILCYLIFLGTILYAIGFSGNTGIAKTLDGEPQMPLYKALVVDVCLLLLLAWQYRIMSRPGFTRWLAKYVSVPLERSTFILLASLCLLLVMWQWQPVGGTVWSVEDEVAKTILLIIYFSGWSIAFVSTFLINHSDLFGLRQVWLYYTSKVYTPLPSFYKLVRHPLYFGFILAYWSVPVMTVAHLLFAIPATAYMMASMKVLPGPGSGSPGFYWIFLFFTGKNKQ